MVEVSSDLTIIRGAYRSGPDTDWHEIGDAMLRVNGEAQPEESPIDPELGVAMHRAIDEVQNNPNQLIVGYRRRVETENLHGGVDTIHSFAALIPKPEAPFKVAISGTDEPEPIYGLQINYQIKEPMAAARDVVFSTPSEQPVWMGAGTHYNPDFLDMSDLQRSKDARLAIGNAAIAELFTDLGEEDDADRNRLLGALFQVALLADDFQIKIPAAPAFMEEAKTAHQVVRGRHAVSSRVITQDYATQRAIKDAREKFERGRRGIKELAEVKSAEAEPTGVSMPYIGDSRTWPYIDVSDYNMEVNNLRLFERTIAREISEHRRRQGTFERWVRLLEAIAGRP